MAKENLVCFNSSLFLSTSVVVISVLVVIISVLLYTVPKLSSVQIDLQKAQEEKQKLQQERQTQQEPRTIYIDRNKNSSYPTSVYIPENTDFSQFQNVGYIYNSSSRLPLYMSRISNKYYYFTRDDSRNNIKIPIDKNGKYEEYYDGDTKSIPELSSEPFTVKLYEDKVTIYNPFGINI